MLVSGLAGEAPAVFADVPFDIAKISSSSDSAFVVVTGEETWSVFDGNTGRLIARRQGSDSDATPNGKVVYEANAPAPHDKDRAELRMFDPSTLQDIPLFSPGKDSVITSFTLDRTGDVLAILASDQIVVINIPTKKRSTIDLPTLSLQWQSLIISDNGNAAVACAFRSPLCLYYDLAAGDSLPLNHPSNADAVSFGASDSDFMTFTWDSKLFFWSALSRGSHDFALTQPEFRLEVAGEHLIEARVSGDLIVTVASREDEAIVQGWRRPITRLLSAETKVPGAFTVRGQAEDANLWLLPSLDKSYLYDFARDEAIEIPFADSTDRVRRLCGSPRLMLVSKPTGLELWDASGSTICKVKTPDQLAPLLSDRERPADLICNQKTLAVASGDKVALWRIDGELVDSPIGAGVKDVRALEQDGDLVVLDSSDTVHVINARGEERASANRPLTPKSGVTFELRSACAVKNKGALLMVPANEEGDNRYVYRFEIVGNEVKVLSESELDASKAYLSAFNEPCTLLAYHAYRTGEAGVFDLDKGQPVAEFALGEGEYWGIDFDQRHRGILLMGGSGQIYLLSFHDELDGAADFARDSVTSCLTPVERATFLLPPEPPPWCITGAGLETEPNPSRWVPKPPYDTEAWKDWLVAVHSAYDQGQRPPPVPQSRN